LGTPHGWLLLAELAVLIPLLLLAVESRRLVESDCAKRIFSGVAHGAVDRDPSGAGVDRAWPCRDDDADHAGGSIRFWLQGASDNSTLVKVAPLRSAVM
jgi:hypothetical protein